MGLVRPSAEVPTPSTTGNFGQSTSIGQRLDRTPWLRFLCRHDRFLSLELLDHLAATSYTTDQTRCLARRIAIKTRPMRVLGGVATLGTTHANA